MAGMDKVVFLDRETVAPQIMVGRPDFAHDWVQYDQTAPDQVVERLQGATIAITNKVALRAEDLAQLPDLKMIAVAATGYDCVDVEYCRQNGIVVSNIRGYAVNTVPEHTFSMILALRRNIIAYHQDVVRGEWERSEQFCFFNHSIRDIAGSNLVIVGGGSIGQTVATLARAFGMRVYFAERKGRTTVRSGYTPWAECLQLADVISLHCPLNEETRNLIAAPEFAQMDRKPILINMARGGVVQEDDLVHAMQAGMVSGAGFDVVNGEPLRTDSPLKALFSMSNFILSPHVAWASDQAQQTLVDQLIGNINYFHLGTPRNVVE